jgi:hypothetical protein
LGALFLNPSLESLTKSTIVKRKVTPWQVLAHRDFGLFWISLLFSAVGSEISTLAIAWQVYEITNSPFQLGLTGLFRALPVMILSIPGGVVADRMDRRRLLIVTQCLATLLALTLGSLTATGQIHVWHIYAITFLSGAVSIFDAPARTALIPLLVPAEQLASAYALNISWRQSLPWRALSLELSSASSASARHALSCVSFSSVIVYLACMRARQSGAGEKESPLKRARRLQFHSQQCGDFRFDEHGHAYNFRRLPFDGAAFARDILGAGPATSALCSACRHWARWWDRASSWPSATPGARASLSSGLRCSIPRV